MFTTDSLTVIDCPSGRWTYVGAIPAALVELKPATKADVTAGRAFKDPQGVTVAAHVPTFGTRDEALHYARERGFNPRLPGQQAVIMRQAIETRYLGPTNTRGSRISVRAQVGRKIYSWKHNLNVQQNHLFAAQQFAKEHGWLCRGTKLVGGELADARGFAFVIVENGYV